VAAEVYNAPQFWSATAELKSRAISQFTHAGAKAIVARDVPTEFLKTGWERVPNTNYNVLIPARE